MEIKEAHKALLMQLGLKQEDFEVFDGKFVRYEYDEEKGVRLYDPYYRTSYEEYIGIDGWSAWSSENDTFMSDILKASREKVRKSEANAGRPDDEKIADSIKKKFGESVKSEQ